MDRLVPLIRCIVMKFKCHEPANECSQHLKDYFLPLLEHSMLALPCKTTKELLNWLLAVATELCKASYMFPDRRSMFGPLLFSLGTQIRSACMVIKKDQKALTYMARAIGFTLCKNDEFFAKYDDEHWGKEKKFLIDIGKTILDAYPCQESVYRKAYIVIPETRAQMHAVKRLENIVQHLKPQTDPNSF